MEAGWRPLAPAWLRQAVRFWEKARARPDGDWLKEAMRANWALAGEGVKDYWITHLKTCLSHLGHTLTWENPVPIDSLLVVALDRWLTDATSAAPLPDTVGEKADNMVRSVPETWSCGFKMLTYCRWMADYNGGKPALLATGLNDSKLIKGLARFRMGLHELQI